jgi:imidazole glycerol-phosphate synthase subunit HisH
MAELAYDRTTASRVPAESGTLIVDYGVGNLGSIRNMLHRIGIEATISGAPEALATARRLILPGIGAFDDGMRHLHERNLAPLVRERVLAGVPTLGICLGAQLLTRGSEEGTLPGLGLFDAEVVQFPAVAGGAKLAVPFMGWSYLQLARSSRLFTGLEERPRFYFAHSYYLAAAEQDVVAHNHYGLRYAAVLERDNLLAVQFHPEKSHRFGKQLLRNFVERYSSPSSV